MKAQRIQTIGQVFEHFGATYDHQASLDENNRRLSHRIYKDTSCGAWAKVEGPGLRPNGRRVEIWHATFRPSILGMVCVAMRKDHSASVSPDKAPQEVREYFCVENRKGRWLLMLDSEGQPVVDLGTLTPDADTLAVRKQHGGGFKLKARVTVTQQRAHQGVVLIGSIVEGVDACVEPDPVYLPCTPDDLDQAVENVESAADDIWMDTHACELCNPDDPDDTRVNPECKDCDGHGTSI